MTIPPATEFIPVTADNSRRAEADMYFGMLVKRNGGLGHFVKNELNAYTLNSITAKGDADGSVTVQFGGCDGRPPNCLPFMQGWTYVVRLYRPLPEMLNCTWHFSEAQPRR